MIETTPDGFRRTRAGALLGALTGPPLLILGAYPLIAPPMATEAQAGTFPWWIVMIFFCWAVGVVGLPLLGAAIGAGAWPDRAAARRLANHCIAGGIAGGALAGILGRAAPGLTAGDGGAVLRLILAEAGLMVAVVLCFRGATEPAPA